MRRMPRPDGDARVGGRRAGDGSDVVDKYLIRMKSVASDGSSLRCDSNIPAVEFVIRGSGFESLSRHTPIRHPAPTPPVAPHRQPTGCHLRPVQGGSARAVRAAPPWSDGQFFAESLSRSFGDRKLPHSYPNRDCRNSTTPLTPTIPQKAADIHSMPAGRQ
jgi:hypothetical protein